VTNNDDDSDILKGYLLEKIDTLRQRQAEIESKLDDIQYKVQEIHDAIYQEAPE